MESFDKIRDGKTSYRKLYTSDYVLDEAVTGCRQRTRNHGLSVALGTLILSSESLLILRVDENTLLEAWELYKSRREIPLSLTDCTSAILARKQGVTDMYSYDSDFEALGFRVLGQLGSDNSSGVTLLSSTPGITVVVGFPFTASPGSPSGLNLSPPAPAIHRASFTPCQARVLRL